jgi:tRNA U34 5-methylaminomethyl-2-thiouridine-forming methyltransferase MnmC
MTTKLSGTPCTVINTPYVQQIGTHQNMLVKILEVGFGTGLNAILTLEAALKANLTIQYVGLEAYPVSTLEIEELNYTDLFENQELKNRYQLMHSSPWNEVVEILPGFTLEKRHEKMETFEAQFEQFDLIYFDAFGPRTQPEMWELPVLQKMYRITRENGFLVTYCAKGQVKRDLKTVGYEVEVLPGPPGKREMTRAFKRMD